MFLDREGDGRDLWFDVVTKRDARALARWWNGHTIGWFEIRRSETNPRFWSVVRTGPEHLGYPYYKMSPNNDIH